MIPAIMPVCNNLELTLRAIKSVENQTIPVELLIILNGPNIDMKLYEYFHSHYDGLVMDIMTEHSVAKAWNRGLDYLFKRGYNKCLVLNNDIELLPITLEAMCYEDNSFVTCVGVDDAAQFEIIPANVTWSRRPNPDFSCFLIHKQCYTKVGAFDENFKLAYCEDWDYHVRMHKEGINAYCINLPFLHTGAGTIKSANEKQIKAIQLQADLNRIYFKHKHGFSGGSEEYNNFFTKNYQP